MGLGTNEPDECPVCDSAYDALQEVDDTSKLQTQGKSNICIANNGGKTFVFIHFQEKYL